MAEGFFAAGFRDLLHYRTPPLRLTSFVPLYCAPLYVSRTSVRCVESTMTTVCTMYIQCILFFAILLSLQYIYISTSRIILLYFTEQKHFIVPVCSITSNK